MWITDFAVAAMLLPSASRSCATRAAPREQLRAFADDGHGLRALIGGIATRRGPPPTSSPSRS